MEEVTAMASICLKKIERNCWREQHSDDIQGSVPISPVVDLQWKKNTIPAPLVKNQQVTLRMVIRNSTRGMILKPVRSGAGWSLRHVPASIQF